MFNVTPNNTGDTLSAMAPNAVREMWQEGCDLFEQTADIFREFEGGPDAVIETKRDFAAGNGMTINFTPRSGFHNTGRSGDQMFTSSDHFAKIKIGHDQLKVDYLRNAFQYTRRMEELMGMRNEITNGLNTEMGDWFGREQSFRLAMTTLHKINSDNILIAGGAASVAALTTAHLLTVDDITTMNSYSRSMGGMPAYLTTDELGNEVWGNVFIGVTAAITGGLKFDPDYKANLQNADIRGSGNLLFKGGIKAIDGNMVREWNDVDHDGDGPVGTPYNPKAYLGVEIAAGTTAFDITGGGVLNSAGTETLGDYFRFFPKRAFEFIAGDTLSTTATTWDLHDVGGNKRFYVRITNPRNKGRADDNKWNMYECNVNAGNTITVTQRLGSAASGIRVTTLGGVTWDGAKNADTHPSGALITLCNENGVTYGNSVMLLKQGLRRGWGAERLKRGQDMEEDGFNTKVYVRSIFGQAPRKRRDGVIPGVFVIRHALDYKGWNMTV